MPELTWVGKDKVITHHFDVPYRVLERQYSFDESGRSAEDNGAENMVIHGDNLEALKALLPKYEGRVKCIYIDPPYNTGNEKWVYNDNVNDPQIKKWLGEVVGAEGGDLSRHDKWLCMMYPRLRLLHKLLSDDGAIFISIDDNEAAHLKLICNEIFGESNFIADISWQKTYSPKNDRKGIPTEVEHILVWAKRPGWTPNHLERTGEMDARYKNRDNDRSAWKQGDASAQGAATHQGMVFAIQHPFTGELIYPPRGRHWVLDKNDILDIMQGWTSYRFMEIDDAARRAELCNLAPSDVRQGVEAIMLTKPIEEARKDAEYVHDRGQWPLFYLTSGGEGGIAKKVYLDTVRGLVPSNLWKHDLVGHTDGASKEVAAIFDSSTDFETTKPFKLIERILKIATDPGDIVLDSFAGSGTTAQAVLNENKRDGGNRRFILVELADYAETITAERVKRVINGYKDVRKEENVLFDQKLSTLAAIKKGAELVDEAKEISIKAKNSGVYTKVGNPRVVKDKITEATHLRVTAVKEHEESIHGTGGSFSFYELGEPLMLDDSINPAVSEKAIREYIWFTETQQPFTPQESTNPHYLGKVHDTVYYFAFDPFAATVLDYDFLTTLDPAHRGEHYVLYADSCALSEKELERMNLSFKKIPRDITAI